ncbi:hypothetical protein ADIS_3230 [Lunatimonas lonarensis]|uniref:Uncharacterized protein n=1 Tax=Lunatimonas lonarensis TaxID=1232681 RepID=R7ZPV0_9BACT|nr:hypothetical protein ADIS_3230 [Lunatimonas lonarensis]
MLSGLPSFPDLNIEQESGKKQQTKIYFFNQLKKKLRKKYLFIFNLLIFNYIIILI